MNLSDQRFGELDFLRGIAVLAMIAYHLCFDLSLYYGYPIAVESGGLVLFARATATLFLTLVGICFVISWERTAPDARRKKYVQRAAIIFFGGMIVTFATWIIDPETFVIFGILHLIAVATLIQYLVRPLRKWNLLLGLLVLSTAFFLPTSGIATPLLLPLGILSKGFTSVDYYPLLPWLGPVLIGMGLGDLLYVPQRRERLEPFDDIQWPHWILWTGRKSLWIYFVHQPILLLILWMLLGK
jgi:uncharacterized membrane protein